MSAKTTELKPCPFCGGEAYSESEDAGWDSRGENLWLVEIGCVNCGASIEVKRHCDHLLRDDDIEGETCHALEELAAAMWNARAIDRDDLLKIADDLDRGWAEFFEELIACEDVDKFEQSIAARIRKAVGE